MTQQKEPSVCESCLEAAQEEGLDSRDDQIHIMQEMGADMPDHLCDQVESEGEITCNCACRVHR